MGYRDFKLRVHWGENLFFLFWLYHVAYGISVPWPGIEPRPQLWNLGILTTGPPVVGGSLYLYTNPFLNSQEDMILLLPFGMYETAFTHILVVNYHPLGIHVALSGWMVALSFWMDGQEGKSIKYLGIGLGGHVIYSFIPYLQDIPMLNHLSHKFWSKWLWNRGNQDLVLEGPRAPNPPSPNPPSPTPWDNLIISGVWLYPWWGLRHNYT